MSNFNMIKEANDSTESLAESIVLIQEVQELVNFTGADGEIIEESVAQFIKDAREFITHGLLPHYIRKSDEQKDDENRDGAVTDPEDKLWYFAKMVGGLMYYMKKDIKANNNSAFQMVSKGMISDAHVDQNIKAMAEKNLQSFIKTVAEKFKDPSVKSQLSKYLDDLESYFTVSTETPVTEDTYSGATLSAPGYYILDKGSNVVAGPYTTEVAAIDSEEYETKFNGFDVDYFSDYDIRRNQQRY